VEQWKTGKVSVDSEVGNGSRWLELPAAAEIEQLQSQAA
jgi:hypothetical protein